MPALMEFLVAPLRYPFMVRGIVAAVLVGLVCALWVPKWCCAVWPPGRRSRAFDLPGIAIGYIVSNGGRGPIFWWGLAGRPYGHWIETLGKGAQIKEDTAMASIFPACFALASPLSRQCAAMRWICHIFCVRGFWASRGQTYGSPPGLAVLVVHDRFLCSTRSSLSCRSTPRG